MAEDFMIIVMADMCYSCRQHSTELTKTLIPKVTLELENVLCVSFSFKSFPQGQGGKCTAAEPQEQYNTVAKWMGAYKMEVAFVKLLLVTINFWTLFKFYLLVSNNMVGSPL